MEEEVAPFRFSMKAQTHGKNNIQDYESDGLYYTSNFLYNYDSKDIYTLGATDGTNKKHTAVV